MLFGMNLTMEKVGFWFTLENSTFCMNMILIPKRHQGDLTSSYMAIIFKAMFYKDFAES